MSALIDASVAPRAPPSPQPSPPNTAWGRGSQPLGVRMSAKTLLDKIRDAHLVRAETESTPAILYVDLHLVHEVTSPQAFTELRQRGLKVRRPDRVLATFDHSTPTTPADAQGRRTYVSAEAESQVAQLEANAREFGVELCGWNSAHRGIVHVIGPELGATQPGMT